MKDQRGVQSWSGRAESLATREEGTGTQALRATAAGCGAAGQPKLKQGRERFSVPCPERSKRQSSGKTESEEQETPASLKLREDEGSREGWWHLGWNCRQLQEVGR